MDSHVRTKWGSLQMNAQHTNAYKPTSMCHNELIPTSYLLGLLEDFDPICAEVLPNQYMVGCLIVRHI